MVEYEALLCGLRIAIETGIKHLDARGNSLLVIDQVMKNANCHDDEMEAYCNAVRALEDKFYGIELRRMRIVTTTRWRPTATPYEPSKTSSTASSSITFPAGTTRRRMNSPTSRQGESPFPQTSLRGTSRDRPSTSS
jgi:hypothetical protein